MLDNANLDMKGHIKIYREEELIFEEDNMIMPDALNIILRSLDTTRNIGVNILNVVTSVGPVNKQVTTTEVFELTNSIVFTTVLVENDFNGYINELYLVSKPTGFMTATLDKFSGKTGLSILKDANTRLKISWQITINKI